LRCIRASSIRIIGLYKLKQLIHASVKSISNLATILPNLLIKITANMYLPTLLTSLALAASTALAAPTTAPNAIVHNKCDYPVYVTSVSADSQEQTQVIAPGHQFYKTQGSGISIKVTKTEKGLYTGKPVLLFSHSYQPQLGLYYDLNHVNGFDFSGEKLRIHNAEGLPVEEIVWVGEPKPAYTEAYLGGPADLTLELCDDTAQSA
jgi:hypothetical protein